MENILNSIAKNLYPRPKTIQPVSLKFNLEAKIKAKRGKIEDPFVSVATQIRESFSSGRLQP